MKVSIPLTVFVLTACVALTAEKNWKIETDADWRQNRVLSENIHVEEGMAHSTSLASSYTSIVKRFPKRRKAKSLTFRQTDIWDNWKEIPKVGVPEMRDAPVFVPVKKGEYWLLARHKNYGRAKDGGYHAWRSADMKNWIHQGQVSNFRERWVTTAEYVNGTFYIYYDQPNDEDPHLILDDDLTDGKMGKDIGMVFDDPSHGSDCGIIREEDGRFHLIYENWDPLNARTHAWDSPLAGRAVSPDGIQPFALVNQVVDKRTNPTGKFAEYIHGTTKESYRYEIHEPDQDAFGDWTAIRIGGQYYLFCDYDPVGEEIRGGRWTSNSLDKEFTWCGEWGLGHPDPTVGFAEGKFYLIRQRADTDFESSGPWVPGVSARAGVDTDGDGKVEEWTDWEEIAESYSQKSGYVRLVDRTPAEIDMSELPKGYGFSFEYRTKAIDGVATRVSMKEIEMSF